MQERERETWIWEMHIARVSFKCLDTYGHQHVYTLHLCSCLQEPHRHGELKVRCDQSLTHVDPKMIKISEEHRRTPNPMLRGQGRDKMGQVFLDDPLERSGISLKGAPKVSKIYRLH